MKILFVKETFVHSSKERVSFAHIKQNSKCKGPEAGCSKSQEEVSMAGDTCDFQRSNQSILNEINPEHSLEGLMLKLKLLYFV